MATTITVAGGGDAAGHCIDQLQVQTTAQNTILSLLAAQAMYKVALTTVTLTVLEAVRTEGDALLPADVTV